MSGAVQLRVTVGAVSTARTPPRLNVLPPRPRRPRHVTRQEAGPDDGGELKLP